MENKEGIFLFKNTLNTFYLSLYGVGHMVKDHSDSERKPIVATLGYSFRLAARVLLYASYHRRITHTTAFVTTVVEHWLERLWKITSKTHCNWTLCMYVCRHVCMCIYMYVEARHGSIVVFAHCAINRSSDRSLVDPSSYFSFQPASALRRV